MIPWRLRGVVVAVGVTLLTAAQDFAETKAFAETNHESPSAPPSFDAEIIPILTKAGCNSGECHGAAAGRSGFRLSLLGADPDADFESIAFERDSRRVNQATPRLSLLFKKPTGEMDHGGDVVLDPDGEHANRMLQWISSGSPRGDRRRLTRLIVSPHEQWIEHVPATIAVHATAVFNDGTRRDVTGLTVFSSADPDAIAFDADAGTATVQRRGQHTVIARFMDQISTLQWTVPMGDTALDDRVARAADRLNGGVVDKLIADRLVAMRLIAGPPATNDEFLRRVTLDLTGRLPTPEEVNSFHEVNGVTARVQYLDKLLASDAFVDHWTLRFSKWLHLHSLPNEPQAVQAFNAWIRNEIAHNAPLDSMVRQLLLTTGDSHQQGPANFARMATDARAHAELFGEAFMGIRIDCANCHSHPLDRWTQDDYHGLAAVFAKLERGRFVRWTERGSVTNLRNNEPARPRIPGERFIEEGEDPIAALANWISHPGNRYFARSVVNRFWYELMGHGLVDPVSDMRDTNPATHPILLDYLTDVFVESGFDFRHLLRTIATSDAYATRSARVGDDMNGGRFYAFHAARMLGPEILADAVADVTGVANRYPGMPVGTRAVSIVDPLQDAPVLRALGRCSRTTGCDQEPPSASSIATQLHLLNGELVNAKLTHPDSRLQRMIAAGHSDDEIVSEFYLRALSRRPSEPERMAWRDSLATHDADERIKRLEDFVWSLLNSDAFRMNH